ncbi:MAG: hypothetical protein Q4E73_10235 [Lachnospiraceae bacterium]|nr:hypothetical protein [Lachnospiraceae bacterium]
MKKKLLLCMSAGLLLLLTACGIDLNTTFSADENFKGTRVMKCSINKNDLTNLNRDFTSIDTIIKENCPETMTYKDQSTDKKISYSFTISFHSLEDYKNKTSKCLNFAPEIDYYYDDSPFANGLLYKENFTSRDLMAWFSESLIKDGFMEESEADKIWNVEDTLFTFDGSDYETDNQININTMSYLPLDSISIYTDMLDTDQYKQTVVFQIPSESLDLDSSGIESYLMDGLDPQLFQWKWNGTKTGRSYQITYSANSLKELNNLAKKVLHGPASLSCKSSLDNKKTFQTNDKYNQKCSLNAFQSSADGKVNYKIYFKPLNGTIQSDKTSTSNGYYLLKEGNSSSCDITFQVNRQQTFSDYRITTVFCSQDVLIRELVLTGTYHYSDKDMKLLSKKLKKLGFQKIKKTADNQILLFISGTPEEISSAYNQLLQTSNPLTAKTEMQKASNSRKSSVSDFIDLSELSFDNKAMGTYYFISNGSESIKNVSLSVDNKEIKLKKLQALEKSSISNDSSLSNFKGEYKAEIENGTVIKFEYDGGITDIYRIVMIIFVCGILIAALIIVLMYKRKTIFFKK